MSTREPGTSAAEDAPAPSRRSLADHLPGLLREARIETVEIDLIHRRPSFHGREVSTDAQSITGPARDEHRRRGFGFWEFVLAEAVDGPSDTRRGLLEGALRHNSDGAIRVQLERETFIERLRDGQYEDLPPRDLVSICSSVAVTGDERELHLPLLDLGVKPTTEGQVAAVDAMVALGLNGLLFESGRSYHFYGAEPVTSRQLVAILARAQLLSPIVDARWVSHQLIDGRCGLRISTDAEKTPFQPSLVARVNSA